MILSSVGAIFVHNAICLGTVLCLKLDRYLPPSLFSSLLSSSHILSYVLYCTAVHTTIQCSAVHHLIKWSYCMSCRALPCTLPSSVSSYHIFPPVKSRYFGVIRYNMLCHLICIALYHTISCHVISYHVMSCHIILCHAMSYHVMSCHLMPCHILLCVSKQGLITTNTAHWNHSLKCPYPMLNP